MDACATLAANLAYLGGGLLLGFAAGRGWRWAEVHDSDHPSRRRHMQVSATTLRGVAYLICGLLAFGTGVFVGFQTLKAEYSCVNDYANNLADSLEPRQTASETLQRRQARVFEATADLIDGNDPDGRKLARALAKYENARDSLDEKRTANPYPQPPREVCQ